MPQQALPDSKIRISLERESRLNVICVSLETKMRGTQYMVTPRIIIPYYTSGEQSWMRFGVERPAQFLVISGGLEETILTLLRCLAPEDQCL